MIIKLRHTNLLLLFSLFSIQSFSSNVEVYFNYCRFNTSNNEKYIETYLSVIGRSLHYKSNKNGNFQAELELTLILKQGDRIFDFKKFNLKSPEIADTLSAFKNFIDIQRLSASNGKYEIELTVLDINDATLTKVLHSEEIIIDFPESVIEISDIQIIESYVKTTERNTLTKGGLDMIPYVANFFPKSMTRFYFYSELYNTNVLGEKEKFLFNYYIEGFETAIKLNDYNGFVKRETDKVVATFNEFIIEKLPTGNYNLVLEIRDKKNDLLAQRKQFFQRSNLGAEILIQDMATINISNSFVFKISNSDSLTEMILSLSPIAGNIESNFLQNGLLTADLKLKQQFFHSFWLNRDPLNPEQAWLKYNEQVQKVDKEYGTKIKKGYSSDRGRIYLKYGNPNTITRNYNESGSYPYEIWHYYKIGNFSNKKFVYYNPDLVTNDFSLLHSDLFGEINNPRWQIVLRHRSNPNAVDFDEEKFPNRNYGSDSDNLYNIPR